MGFRYLSGPFEIREYPEDETSGSFVAGDLVKLSSGEVVLATVGLIFGVALKSATGTSATAIPVMIVRPDQEWVCAADTTTAATMEGAYYDVNFTAGSQGADLGSQTQPDIVIQKLDPRDGAHTGSGGRVIVRFMPSSLTNTYGVS
jgi:hypothetical protein